MKRITLLYCFLLSSGIAVAQTTQFSQFFASSAYLNPAFVGLESTPSLTMNYKSMVSENEVNQYQLSHVSVAIPINKTTTIETQNAGVGMSFVQEYTGFEGIFSTTNVLVSGSYVMNLDVESKKIFSFGLQGGVIQKSIDPANLQFGSQYNPYIGHDDTLPIETLINYKHLAPTFNFGVIYSQKDHHNPILSENGIIAGLSAHGINSPTNGFSDQKHIPIQYKAFVSANTKLRKGYFIHPSAYITWTAETYQLNAGMYASQYIGKTLSTMVQVGAWVRHKDSYIVLAGVQHNNWKAGLSVDFNSSNINENPVLNVQGNQPTWELSFSFKFATQDKIIKVTNPLF